MIYFTDELYEKLKAEENVSALIQRLIKNHYDLISDPKDKLEETKKNIEKLNQEADSLIIKVGEMEKKKEEILIERIQEEEDMGVSEEKQKRIKALNREIFCGWDIQPDKIDEMLEDYYNNYKDKGISILGFMGEKGIHKKVRQTASLKQINTLND